MYQGFTPSLRPKATLLKHPIATILKCYVQAKTLESVLFHSRSIYWAMLNISPTMTYENVPQFLMINLITVITCHMALA